MRPIDRPAPGELRAAQLLVDRGPSAPEHRHVMTSAPYDRRPGGRQRHDVLLARLLHGEPAHRSASSNRSTFRSAAGTPSRNACKLRPPNAARRRRCRCGRRDRSHGDDLFVVDVVGDDLRGASSAMGTPLPPYITSRSPTRAPPDVHAIGLLRWRRLRPDSTSPRRCLVTDRRGAPNWWWGSDSSSR